MKQKVSESIADLRLAVVDEVAKKRLEIDPSSEDCLKKADFGALAKIVREEAKSLDLRSFKVNAAQDVGKIEKQLKRYISSPNRLKEFCRVVGEQLFVSGKVSLSGLHPDTARLLIGVVRDLGVIRGKARGMSGEKLLSSLRQVDKKIEKFISDNTRGQEEEGGSEKAARLNTISYGTLNKQHIRIARAIKKVEQNIIKELPRDIQRELERRPLFNGDDLKSASRRVQHQVQCLVKLGVVHVSDGVGEGRVYAYPHGSVTQGNFESQLSPQARERLGAELHQELRKKYSGKARRIGIAASRDEGVPSLLDKMRVHFLSERTGLKPGHIVLGLKYFAQQGLLQNDEDGYVLSSIGRDAGLGVRAVEAVRRARSNGTDGSDKALLDAFIEQASRESELRASAHYSLSNDAPGMPRTVIMDEIKFPTNTVETGLLQDAIARTQSGETSAQLAIVGGLLVGDPALARKGVRSWTSGIRSREDQIPLADDLFDHLKSPTIHVAGRAEDVLAERRAYLQALREKAVHNGATREAVSEDALRGFVDRLNNQSQYSQMQNLAVQIADWSRFISLVAQPLEMKLGRALYESEAIQERTGIEMNELEIIRAISQEIMEKGSLDACQADIHSRFGEYLAFAEKDDSLLLEKLNQVLDPGREQVARGQVVSRSGMRLSMIDAQQRGPIYDVAVVPTHNYGKLPRANPTAGYEGWLRAQLNLGRRIAPMHLLFDTGETVGELSSHGAWIISGGTMQGSASQMTDLYYSLNQDRARRDATVYGRPPQSSFVVVSGGVHEGKITQAIEYQIVTPKLLQVLESNRERGLPRKKATLYVTSDWQIGSPTMKPAMVLSGLIDAVDRGCEEILINGDIRQGMNYLRYTQEAQLVEYPLNGLDSQGQYIYELLNPVLDYIWRKKAQDPTFKPPVFRILPGNHESNTQANKGLQGTWFVQDIAEKIRENYAAHLGDDRRAADRYVICPEKYVDHDGTQVDYPMIYVNRTEDMGICLQMTHYNNSGSKGSSFAPTVTKVANAVHSLGVVEPHIRIESHMHVPGFMVRNGVVSIRTGANATGSAFEQHLLYENCAESNLHITLDSHHVPTFFVATRAYQETRDAALIEKLHAVGLLREFGSFEQYCFERRKLVSLKERGNPTNLTTEEFRGPHQRHNAVPAMDFRGLDGTRDTHAV